VPRFFFFVLSKSMRHFLFVCALCALALSSTLPASAQRNPTDVIAQGTSYHVFAQPGEATMEILVLGDAAAGVYVVGENINLSKFLALIGGAGGEGVSADTEVTKSIRLLREQGGQRVVVYEAQLEEMLRDPSAYPALQGGDIFTVETEARRRFNLRETLSIVSSLGTLTLLTIRLIEATN
jgi:hypothetical protein